MPGSAARQHHPSTPDHQPQPSAPAQLELRLFARLDAWRRTPPDRALFRELIDVALGDADHFMDGARKVNADHVHHVACLLFNRSNEAGIIEGFSLATIAKDGRKCARTVKSCCNVLRRLHVYRSSRPRGLRSPAQHRLNAGGMTWPAVRKRAQRDQRERAKADLLQDAEWCPGVTTEWCPGVTTQEVLVEKNQTPRSAAAAGSVRTGDPKRPGTESAGSAPPRKGGASVLSAEVERRVDALLLEDLDAAPVPVPVPVPLNEDERRRELASQRAALGLPPAPTLEERERQARELFEKVDAELAPNDAEAWQAARDTERRLHDVPAVVTTCPHCGARDVGNTCHRCGSSCVPDSHQFHASADYNAGGD